MRPRTGAITPGRAITGWPPVGLQLGLAGATGADGTLLPLQVLPHTRQPGQEVLVLGQGYLQAALANHTYMFEKTELKEINRAVLAGLNSPALSQEENACGESLDELPLQSGTVWG